ncbi:protein of unknown function (plasmid) [Candidatus Methylocalor cossyra]|uniref:Uncharacterized protein n=1 Tax=Candidatus Methylocalor cossyra TaxID=3108543 RepID=A0ABM9NMQ9_9GAMM
MEIALPEGTLPVRPPKELLFARRDKINRPRSQRQPHMLRPIPASGSWREWRTALPRVASTTTTPARGFTWSPRASYS